MNLLLFLSALLTGLTGAISAGQRADAPAVQQSIARAVEIATDKVVQQSSPTRQQATAAHRPAFSALGAKPGWALVADAPAIDVARIYEKLLV